MTDIITVAQWNLEHDGGPDGADWSLAHDILRSYEPHIVLRQEMTHSHKDGARRLFAAERALGGLRGFIAQATPESPNACGLFIDPALFETVAEYRHQTLWWHPMCNVVVKLGDCPTPISVASFHLCSHDPDTRLTEARRLTTLGKPGMVSLIGGDCNSYPHVLEPLKLPNWPAVGDRSHIAHRTYLEGGHLVSDTRPDRVLHAAGFEDLARYAYDHLGEKFALSATAGQSKLDQGGPQRIDRTYGAGGLAAALESVEVVDNADTHSVSDHSLLILRFHRVRLERVLRAQPATAAAR